MNQDMPQPDVAEVQQANEGDELPIRPIPVEVAGPVTVVRAPSRRLVVTEVPLHDQTPARLLHNDLKRARAVIMGIDPAETPASILVSSTEVGTFAPWPPGVPLTIEAAGDLWAKTANDSGNVVATVVIEVWAD
jgi:hypothetical protein